MSLNVYIRNIDENGHAIAGSYTFTETISRFNNSFVFVVPRLTKVIIIFEFLIEDGAWEFNYNLEQLPIENPIITDTYMFETFSGLPYEPHSMGSYSEFEFTKTPMSNTRSVYTGKTAVSRMVISHKHENERGYVDRVYISPKRGRHGQRSVKNRLIKNSEQIYIYLDPLDNAKQITSASNNVVRSIMLQTTDII